MRRAILLATAASALAFSAHAEDEPTEVGEVIVTTTRLPAPQPEVAGAYVIEADRIQDSGAVLAADILSEIPGVSLYNQGPFGGVTSVRLRGAGQDKTLVLLDGVPLNDPSQPAGGYDFASLELGDIERIEVLSGPQGSLWGSDAIGGVIAFTSRELDGLRLDAEAGSLGTLRGSAAVGTRSEGYAFGLFASAHETDGVSRAEVRDGNTEADGFENRTLAASGRIEAGPVSLDGRLRWNDAVAELDGYPPPNYAFADTDEVSDTESVSGFLRSRFGLFGFEHALTFARSDIDRAITGGAFPSRYTGAREAVRWQAERALFYNTVDLIVGLEREDTDGDLSTGTAAELGATSAFGVARVQATERLSASLSVRWDDPDGYDAETTLRASAAYELAPGLTLSGAYGQGFKTPTISQTVCDFCFSFSPYPVLRPERAEGVNLGLSWRSADGARALRATAFWLEVTDEITFLFDPLTYESVYVNLARTRSTGLELEGEWDITPAFEIRAAYAFTDAEDQDGARLLRVPEHSGSGTLAWREGPWRAQLTVRGESDQADAGGTREGFVIGRFAGGYALSDQAELTLRVENLTDAAYQETLFYGEAGRAVYAGLRLRY